MRGVVVVVVLLCLGVPARAQGERFAILPTQSTPAVQAEASLVENVLTSGLAKRSLAHVPLAEVRAAMAPHEAVCNSLSLVACAALVGADVKATKMVVSDLYGQGDGFELSLVVVDLKDGTAQGEAVKVSARDRGTLLQVAESALLDALHLERFGELTVRGPAGATVVVDGIIRDGLPMMRPLRAPIGRHAIEVRHASLKSWQGFVDIKEDAAAAVTLCADASALAGCDGAPPTGTPPPPGPSPLLIGGLAGTGAGVVGVAAGAVLAGMAAGGYEELRGTRRDDVTQSQIDSILQTQTASVVCFVAGTALVVAGAGVSVAATVLE